MPVAVGTGDQTPYVEVWWDDDNDDVNDNGFVESAINFNTAQGLSTGGDQKWIIDVDNSSSPVVPQGRFLILKSDPAMIDRAQEYVIIGYVQSDVVPAENTYSYTKYDRLGRIVEVGQAILPVIDDGSGGGSGPPSGGGPPGNPPDPDDNPTTPPEYDLEALARNVNETDFPALGAEITHTVYTEASPGPGTPGNGGDPDAGVLTSNLTQRYLRNRVSYTYLDEDGNENTIDDRTYTAYSYDPHGNVEWLAQRVPGLPLKLIEYEYDLISGNVLMVSYNPGQSDQFYHKYEYDGDNRIIEVMTSINGHLWDTDAKYEYYAHGPLKTAVIGQDRVQQLDYVYTIHGWLKAINDPTSNEIADAELTGEDAFAMALKYYSGDYLGTANVGSLTPATGRDLYNGNIAAWEVATHASDDSWMRTGFQYTYDELNRIRDSRFNVFREGPNFLDRGGFQADYTLDANGNLKTLNRNDIDAVNFDALTYHLQPGTNKLDYVEETNDDVSLHPKDIDPQDPGNYSYDNIGNLTADRDAGTGIEWTVYGKVDEVIKGAGGTKFTYDAAGNRVKKNTTDDFGNTFTTFYIRDASGNIMSTYRQKTVDGVSSPAEVIEIPIYGSDRLGTYTPEGALENNQESVAEVTADLTIDQYEGTSYELEQGVSITLQPGFSYEDDVDGNTFEISGPGAMEATTAADVYTRRLERKQYELKDHLGNVRAVVTDRKLSDISGSTASNFRPQIASASAYYPYGMDLPTVRWEPETVVGTMEAENAPEEILAFDNYTDVTRVSEPNPPTSAWAFTLDGIDGGVMGLAKSYKVQAGDKISATVKGKYEIPGDDRTHEANIPILLTSVFLNTFAVPGTQEGQLVTDLLNDWSLGPVGMLNEKSPNDDQVMAGITWLAFDNDFVMKDGGFINLTQSANGTYDLLDMGEHIIGEDGYVFVYTSNESPQLTEVFFDDMTVTHEKLVPDDVYDPNLVAYRYGFNGKEKDQVGEWGGSATLSSFEIIWQNLVDVTYEDGKLIGGGGNANASSENILPAGEDGWIEFTSNSAGFKTMGFADVDEGSGLAHIDYAVQIRSGLQALVIENGTGVLSVPFTFGDVIRISRTSGVITYAKNGEVFYESLIASNGLLIADTWIQHANATIESARSSFSAPGQEETLSSRGLVHYDYGFRIYNPALGRFLSVDPLTRSYPMLTPYQFASNSPISGIDLDGLEYLDHREARVEMVGGTPFIKLENFSNIYQSKFRRENPHYGLVYRDVDGTAYGEGMIGDGPIFIPTTPKRKEARLSNKTNDPAYNPTNVTLKGTNRAARRQNARKGAPIISTGPGPSRGAAGAVILLNAINFSLELYVNKTLRDDQDALSGQVRDRRILQINGLFDEEWITIEAPLNQALRDIQSSIDSGLIPEENQNVDDLSAITNIVLFGGDGNESENLQEIGNKIIDDVCKCRKNDSSKDN